MTCPWVGFSPSLRRISEPQTEPALAADVTPGVGGPLRGCLGAILPSPDPCLAMRAAILHVIIHVPTYVHARVYAQSLHHTRTHACTQMTQARTHRARVSVHTYTTYTDCTHTDTLTQVHMHTCVYTDMHATYTQSMHTQVHAHTQTCSHTRPCIHTSARTHVHPCVHMYPHSHRVYWAGGLTSISSCPGHCHKLLTTLPASALPPHPFLCHAVCPPCRGPRDLFKPKPAHDTPPLKPPAVPVSLRVKAEVLTIMKDTQHPIAAAMLTSCFPNTPGGIVPCRCHIAMSRDTFSCYTWCGCCWNLVGRYWGFC